MAAEFKSRRSYRDFAMSVTRRWRHVRTADDAGFIEAVVATSTGKEELIPIGFTLWRAQTGNDWQTREIAEGVEEELPAPMCKERMKPPAEWVNEGKAVEGRVNPKGIPCLYTATHQRTAISEVRPWLGAFVSIAQLQ